MESPDRSAITPAMPREVAISLSGGGVRALLFGLGALRAVIAAREQQGHKLTVLAGVSGGGIAAAFAASRVKISDATLSSYDSEVLAPAFRTITTRSLMFGTWYFPGVLAAAGLCLVFAIVAASGVLGVGLVARIALTALAVAAIPIVATLRGLAIEKSMGKVLFGGDSRLVDADSGCHLVLQTTDLASGEATYLTSRGLYSFRWKDAPAGDLSVVRAARGSATFPVVFGPLRLDASGFTAASHPGKLSLVDGGIYDNMGSEWLLNPDHTPTGTYKIVVNASRNLGQANAPFSTPLLGEALVLLREKDIQYDATTAPRRRWLRELFRLKAHDGTLVLIDKSIRDWVKPFSGGKDERGERARNVLDATKSSVDLDRWPDANASIGTSLGKIPSDRARDLVLAGYMATAIQTHILEGWPPPESFSSADIMPWLGQAGVRP